MNISELIRTLQTISDEIQTDDTEVMLDGDNLEIYVKGDLSQKVYI